MSFHLFCYLCKVNMPCFIFVYLFRSATVDSSLFSRYFGHCPVIIAEGRTHPVSTNFLEDIYEKLNYCLASDSRASGTSMTMARQKVKEFSFSPLKLWEVYLVMRL